MSQLFQVVGKTEEGASVVSGVYSFYETQGCPLETILEKLRDSGFIPSWTHLYVEMLLAGISFSRAMSRLDAAIVDSGWDPEYRDEIIDRLKGVHSWAETLLDTMKCKSDPDAEGILVQMLLDGTLFAQAKEGK